MTTLRLRYEGLKSGTYAGIMKEEGKKIARAASNAFREVAGHIRDEGRSSIAAGGLSGRFQNAMYAKVYPQNGDSLEPAIVAGLKARYASVFETGETISGQPLMWLPLDSAPQGRGGKRMGPDEFARSVGTLYSINHPGRAPLLAAVVRETDARARKAPSITLLRRGRNPGGRGSVRLVPIFVGVPTVSDPKKYEVTAIIRKWADQVVSIFDQQWEAIDG